MSPLFLVLALAVPASSPDVPSPAPSTRAPIAISDAGPLAPLLGATLDHAPEIALARARARALEARIPHTRALADPSVQLTVFPLPPETRAGAQRLSAGLAQRFPWPGIRGQRADAARADADAAYADAEAVAITTITETRRLAHELVYVDAYQAILDDEHEHLTRHEESAEARYVAGSGLAQAVIKIQAEITRLDEERLALGIRRTTLVARLAELTGGMAFEPSPSLLPDASALSFVHEGTDPWQPSTPPERTTLESLADSHRPALAAARYRLVAATVRSELVVVETKRPELTAGFTYTFVEPRDDVAFSPPDDGDDVLALQLGVSLPVWREKNTARVLESEAEVAVAEAALVRERAALDRELDDLTVRIPRLQRQLVLYRDVLLVQAEESLASAETAYATGSLGALDLLDAEHVLFEVRASALRTVTDLAHARAALDHAVGVSLSRATLESIVPAKEIP